MHSCLVAAAGSAAGSAAAGSAAADTAGGAAGSAGSGAVAVVPVVLQSQWKPGGRNSAVADCSLGTR